MTTYEIRPIREYPAALAHGLRQVAVAVWHLVMAVGFMAFILAHVCTMFLGAWLADGLRDGRFNQEMPAAFFVVALFPVVFWTGYVVHRIVFKRVEANDDDDGDGDYDGGHDGDYDGGHDGDDTAP